MKKEYSYPEIEITKFTASDFLANTSFPDEVEKETEDLDG